MQKENKKVIGTYAFTAFSGIEVLDIEYGNEDFLVYRYASYEKESGRINRAKIRYTHGGRAYVQTANGRIHLDDILVTE